MPPKKKEPKPEKNTDPAVEHETEEQSSNGQGPSSKDQRRPSIGDMWGRPSMGGGGNLAAAVLQVTRDQQNWLATGILTEREIAQAKRMLAKQMSRHGRLDMERLVFQAGHLARSKDGYSLEMYKAIAGAEMKRQAGFDGFYNRFNPGTQQQIGPQAGQ